MRTITRIFTQKITVKTDYGTMVHYAENEQQAIELTKDNPAATYAPCDPFAITEKVYS